MRVQYAWAAKKKQGSYFQAQFQRLSPQTQARKRAQRIAKPGFTGTIAPALQAQVVSI